jgi:hypothetical protein
MLLVDMLLLGGAERGMLLIGAEREKLLLLVDMLLVDMLLLGGAGESARGMLRLVRLVRLGREERGMLLLILPTTGLRRNRCFRARGWCNSFHRT